MTGFAYKALDGRGRVLRGMLDAESARQARQRLRGRRLKPIEVRPCAKQDLSAARRLAGPALGPRDLALLTRQLATLVRSGVPLDEALGTAARQAPRVRVKSLLLALRASVLEGRSLAAALADFPRVFDSMYRSMVRAGEQAGFLAQVLEQLADYVERRQHTRQKLRMALLYPLVLMGVAAAVVGLLMVLVIPELVGLFARGGARLPLLTRWLIGLSGFLAAWWWVLLLLAAALAAAARLVLARPGPHLAWHRLLLRLPLAGELLRAADSARFASTLAILMGSGVPLLEGLRIAGAVMRNRQLQDAARQLAAQVQEGGSLHQAMEDSGAFPPMLVQMAASGAASGDLQTMLERAAHSQERELELTLGTLMGLLEPLVIVLMAVVVGAIVLAVLLPVFEMNALVN